MTLTPIQAVNDDAEQYAPVGDMQMIVTSLIPAPDANETARQAESLAEWSE